MAEARTARATGYVIPAKKTIIGSSVVNQQNEDLGKIEDVVIDTGAARIAYVVLSFGGFLGLCDKYFAIPWEAFRFDSSEKRAVLNVDRRLLENARVSIKTVGRIWRTPLGAGRFSAITVTGRIGRSRQRVHVAIASELNGSRKDGRLVMQGRPFLGIENYSAKTLARE